LAMAAAIWHNNATNAPITRSLIATTTNQRSDLLV
jgi:hypothetical protein